VALDRPDDTANAIYSNLREVKSHHILYSKVGIEGNDKTLEK
jgi:hypothetical protein